MLLAQTPEGKTRTRAKYSPSVIKHSKVEYKNGRFRMREARNLR